jgi:hypothetical protein
MQPAVSGGGFLRLIPPNFGTSAHRSVGEQTAWRVGGRGVAPLGYAPPDIAPKATSPSPAAKATGVSHFRPPRGRMWLQSIRNWPERPEPPVGSETLSG